MIARVNRVPFVSAIVTVLVAPLLMSLPAHAMAIPNVPSQPLQCYSNDEVQTGSCDLHIYEKVSIDSSMGVEAQSADQAVQAKTGDTVTWTITVDSDSSTGNFPHGIVTVTDAIPSQVNFVSATPSVGTYSNGSWNFSLINDNTELNNYPATLTVVGLVNMTGTFTNTATLADYSEYSADPPYTDSNNANNVACGYVSVAAPVAMTKVAIVTPVAKAPDTGFGVDSRNIWLGTAGSLLVALPLAGISRKLRQMSR